MKKIETDEESHIDSEFSFSARIPGIGMSWQELSARSHYQTAVEIERALLDGNYSEAESGIKELIEALGRSERRALKSQLIRLMAHIIKWKAQPEHRSYGWAGTILNARDEIVDIQAETPSLTDGVIKQMWESCFRSATREAQGEMNQKSTVSGLSWEQVFEEEYETE